jgi:hypothetical protein
MSRPNGLIETRGLMHPTSVRLTGAAVLACVAIALAGCDTAPKPTKPVSALDPAAAFTPDPASGNAKVAACHYLLAPADVPADFPATPRAPLDCSTPGSAGVSYGNKTDLRTIEDELRVMPDARATQSAFPAFVKEWSTIWPGTVEQPAAAFDGLGDQVQYFTKIDGAAIYFYFLILRRGTVLLSLAVTKYGQFSSNDLRSLAQTALNRAAAVH